MFVLNWFLLPKRINPDQPNLSPTKPNVFDCKTKQLDSCLQGSPLSHKLGVPGMVALEAVCKHFGNEVHPESEWVYMDKERKCLSNATRFVERKRQAWGHGSEMFGAMPFLVSGNRRQNPWDSVDQKSYIAASLAHDLDV